MKIVRLNPFPPYPPLPGSIAEGDWIKALLYYRPFVEWRIKELRGELLASKVPPSKIPSTSELVSQDAGFVDAMAAAMAQIGVPGDKFWATVPPEEYVASMLNSAFGAARGNKSAEKKIATEIRFLSNRIRDDLLSAGRTPAIRAASAPPSARSPSAPPPSAPPPSARPPSASKPHLRLPQ